ncbi:nucleotide-diphospho-sugar transferase, partial [Geopyxis carbonaria]
RDRSQIGKEKASIVMLVRNWELADALKSIKQIEERFNRHYRYPWTFLNDEEFTEEFRIYTSIAVSGEAEYGLVPKEHWGMPDWISKDKSEKNRQRMERDGVIYGDSKTYRHMCRFNSGFFWRHELLEKYDWYWRVEPYVGFYCDQLYDPFTFMRENNKSYSFVIALPEYVETIPTLWKTVQSFARKHPEHIAPDNSLSLIAENAHLGLQNVDYNMCHFWSNFELGSLQFFRSQAYRDYFDYLDAAGGFYYERWGDAPVHSIAAALLLPKDHIHFWDDFGYSHVPWGRCPVREDDYTHGRCQCEYNGKEKSFDFNEASCLSRWYLLHNKDEDGNIMNPFGTCPAKDVCWP